MTIDQSTLLDERYRLEERIGTGGMADVFRATDEVLNRHVAVKVLREVSDETSRSRFIEEARTLAALDHPGLITLLDAGIRGERPYLVMTLVTGATLSARILDGPMPSDEVKAIGAQMARALAYAHGQGIVHRDVKPSNVLLCGDGRALLADFGIARLVGSTEHHTRTGDAIGSPAYLAPEQVAGEALTPALDIYSFGLVLLEALTAQRAFPGTPVEAAVARLNAAPPMPTTLDPGWRELLARMTHRVPENRPSAAEVADELGFPVAPGSALTTGAVFRPARPTPETGLPADATGDMAVVTMESPFHSAGPVGLDSTYSTEPRRRRVWAQAAGLGLVALLMVAALVWVLRPHSSAKTDGGSGVPANVPSK
ncbi:MAG: serine/threonine-protein kinase, partial [Marmoricola sp.]